MIDLIYLGPMFVELAAFPAVQRWFEVVGARAAVAKGMAVPA